MSMGRECFKWIRWWPPGVYFYIFEQIWWCFGKVFLMSIRSKQQLFSERPIYIDISCILITYPISCYFCKKRFSGILLALQFSIFLGFSVMALQFSIFLASSFIGDFLFTSFQQKNEIKKGNTLMEFKYLTFLLENRFVWRQRFQKKIRKENLMLPFSWLKEFS